ncbi:hypothetical protein BpHYR1_014908 [Brachionus plicatilis]|uniref:Uncharacterized protein n=1 Tax=Brachionus plicatilis TaxID=10195 RepID=A0A3M7R9G0_BRAPC|nr:hypothetical protein BpHYR1_014908 [Brachionus plicatilis]
MFQNMFIIQFLFVFIEHSIELNLNSSSSDKNISECSVAFNNKIKRGNFVKSLIAKYEFQINSFLLLQLSIKGKFNLLQINQIIDLRCLKSEKNTIKYYDRLLKLTLKSFEHKRLRSFRNELLKKKNGIIYLQNFHEIMNCLNNSTKEIIDQETPKSFYNKLIFKNGN